MEKEEIKVETTVNVDKYGITPISRCCFSWRKKGGETFMLCRKEPIAVIVESTPKKEILFVISPDISTQSLLKTTSDLRDLVGDTTT